MTSITANKEMVSVLAQAREVVEVRDTEGKVIGYFAPVAAEQAQRFTQALAQLDSGTETVDPLADLRGDFDMVEVERRVALNEPGIPFSEVLGHLKFLTSEPAMCAYLEEKIKQCKEREQERCTTR